MNAEELIAEVIAIVDDPDYQDTEKMLKRLNEAQQAIATKVLLPDLLDGTDDVDTVVDTFQAALPATYHRTLYLAFVGEDQVDVYNDMQSMNLVRGGISLDAGDVEAVCVHSGLLLYQPVPAAVTAITLYYYRKPVDMVERADSFPDGAAGNDDFEWALIHHAASKVFSKIEDGLEGQKANTAAQKSLYEDRVALLDDFAVNVGKSFPKRPASGIGWLGVK